MSVNHRHIATYHSRLGLSNLLNGASTVFIGMCSVWLIEPQQEHTGNVKPGIGWVARQC